MGGPFCGVGLLLKKVPWHEGGILMPPPSLPSYSTDLASVAHTRPRYGSRAAAAFAGKGVDPSKWQQLVWHRETDRSFGVVGQTIWIKGSQGRVWSRTILILHDNNIPHLSQDGVLRVDTAFAMIIGPQMHKL